MDSVVNLVKCMFEDGEGQDSVMRNLVLMIDNLRALYSFMTGHKDKLHGEKVECFGKQKHQRVVGRNLERTQHSLNLKVLEGDDGFDLTHMVFPTRNFDWKTPLGIKRRK